MFNVTANDRYRRRATCSPMYKVLGIDTSFTFTDNSGRPHPILNQGKPIVGLI